MNPLEHLIPAILAALTGLQWAGVAVPVFQELPGNSAGHYVLLTQPTDTDNGRCGASCTVLLDVVTQFAGQVSHLPAESLTTQIHARLRRQRLALPAGWDCQPAVLEPTNQLTELGDELRAVRRLLRYRWDISYPQNS